MLNLMNIFSSLLVWYLLACFRINSVKAQVTSCYLGQTSSYGNILTPTPVACSVQAKNSTLGSGPYMCGKLTQSSGPMYAIIYSCLPLSSKEGCGASITANGITLNTYCCFTDNCNSAAFFYPNKLFIAVLVAVYFISNMALN